MNHRPSAAVAGGDAGVTSAPGRLLGELSLVMPALNEEAGIARVVLAARDALASRCGRFEIVVVDDGSTDATPQLLALLAAQVAELRVVTHETNRGYAAALVSGLGAARFDPVAYTDADGQFDLADLDRAVPLFADGADMVAGYRARRADPWTRKAASFGFNLLARLATGIRARDVDCAFKLFRRSFLDSIRLASDGFLIDTELFARARQADKKVLQLPVTHLPRLAGRSTVRFGAVWSSARELLALRRTLRAETVRARSRKAGTPAPAPRRRNLWERVGWRAAPTALALALALAAQGARPLAEPDEGRYVQAALAMLDSGDWLVPRLEGVPYLDKPPMVYWLTAGSLRLFGASELAARLPEALAFAATAAVVTWLGGMLWGGVGGTLAGLVYALSVAPFVASNIVTPDTPLALFASLTAALVWAADVRGRRRLWLLAGVAAGLGVLTKGAGMLVFVLPLALALSLAHGGLGWLRRPGPWLATGGALAVALPWFAWIATHLPGAFDYFVSNQVTGRLVDVGYDRNPHWSSIFTLYLPVLGLGCLPWTVTGLVGLRRRRPGEHRPWSREVNFVAAWIVVPFAIFALAKSRLPLYLLPLFAPLALALARPLESRLAGATAAARIATVVAASAWVVALLALKLAASSDSAWPLHRDGRRLAEWVSAARPSPASRVIAVDVDLHSLPFYGLPRAGWATTKDLPYPMYSTLPALAELLAAEGSGELLLVTTDAGLRRADAAAARAGYLCRADTSSDRLALLDCRRRTAPGATG